MAALPAPAATHLEFPGHRPILHALRRDHRETHRQ